jgi:hypothetical protein
MTRNKTRALLLAVTLSLGAALLTSFPPEARAQNTSASPNKKSLVKTQFVVLHMLYQSLQVRSVTNVREVHTFSYAPAIHGRMQLVYNAGGYQFGDKVTVWYQRGGSVAFKIKGKPSKAKLTSK